MRSRCAPLLVLIAMLAGCSRATPRVARVDGTVAPVASEQPLSATARAAPAGFRTAPSRQAAPFDPGAFALTLEPVFSSFKDPVYLTGAGDGNGRLFVVERGGVIRVIVNGETLSEPFLDVRSLITAAGQEQGLLGLVFHPRFAENGRFFVAYTARNGDDTLVRYQVSADPNRADPASATVLYAIPDPAPNHNGGMLAFGPDGYLYTGLGDGGGGGDQYHNAQNLGSLLGKLLRLDVDGGEPYAVPPDNPFVGQPDVRPEIWAYGLRNPWRFSFDRATGDLFIADVGQNVYEEVNYQRAGDPGGENYGWSIYEGFHCYRPNAGCDPTGLTPPVGEYDHSGGGCSVSGGYVYRGNGQPLLSGGYFYGDYCSGQIWSLQRTADGAWVQTELLQTKLHISSFGEDDAGELYVLDLAGGIYRLGATPR